MTVAKTAKAVAANSTESQKGEAVEIRKESIGAPIVTVIETPFLGKDQFDAALKAGSAAFLGYEEVLQFSKANIEALVASSTIVARGVQDLSKSFAALAQDSLEDSMSAGKAFVGAKTLKEVFDLSSSYAKANFDKLLAESAKLSQMSTKLAEDALAPIGKRVEATVERMTKTAA